jgi:hypothetical protein
VALAVRRQDADQGTERVDGRGDVLSAAIAIHSGGIITAQNGSWKLGVGFPNHFRGTPKSFVSFAVYGKMCPMKRRFIYGFVSMLLALNLILGARVYVSSSAHAEEQKDSAYSNVELFDQVLEKIRTEYVDGTNMSYHGLVYSAIKGMVASLDPHSEFLDPADYQELQDDTEGQFGGLGLVVSLKDGYVTVISPMDDSPGFRAGILPDDRIEKIDGKAVAEMIR